MPPMTPPKRAAMPSDDAVELRGSIPREVIDVLDAWSQAKGMNRVEGMNVILRKWAMNLLREHMVISRVTKNNPLLDQIRGEGSE